MVLLQTVLIKTNFTLKHKLNSLSYLLIVLTYQSNLKISVQNDSNQVLLLYLSLFLLVTKYVNGKREFNFVYAYYNLYDEVCFLRGRVYSLTYPVGYSLHLMFAFIIYLFCYFNFQINHVGKV